MSTYVECDIFIFCWWLLKQEKKVWEENWRIPNCTVYIFEFKPECTFLRFTSPSLFVCSFLGGWGEGGADRTKRLCYQSCKMVYYSVSNCTWKGTSNLYEKCLRSPVHPVIHARSVPVMPENKRRCTSLGKRHLIRLKSLWREALKCHFLKWTGHYHLKSWGAVGLGRRERIFLLISQALKC